VEAEASQEAKVTVSNRKPEASIDLPRTAKSVKYVTVTFPNGEHVTLVEPGKMEKRIQYRYDEKAKKIVIEYERSVIFSF
jgi:hypothetical protein